MKPHRLDIAWTKYRLGSGVDTLSRYRLIGIFVRFSIDIPDLHDIID
jgi:hypothetical protein